MPRARVRWIRPVVLALPFAVTGSPAVAVLHPCGAITDDPGCDGVGAAKRVPKKSKPKPTGIAYTLRLVIPAGVTGVFTKTCDGGRQPRRTDSLLPDNLLAQSQQVTVLSDASNRPIGYRLVVSQPESVPVTYYVNCVDDRRPARR